MDDQQEIDLLSRGLIMGILSFTPDIFSDGGQCLQTTTAAEHALVLEAQGAQIIDIGGKSTRTGAPAVAEEEVLRRIIPVIRALRGRSKVLARIFSGSLTFMMSRKKWLHQ